MSTSSQSLPFHRAPVRVAAIATAALGALVLAGWHLRIPAIIQLHPSFVPMQYNTALGFIAAGAGLAAAAASRWRGAMTAGAAVAAIGALTLAEHLSGIDAGIDQLLMKHYITVGTPQAGRPAPNTALCLLLAGAALFVAGFHARGVKRWQAVGVLSALTMGLAAVALTGYLIGMPTAYGWGSLTRMAVHTALGMIVLAGGLIVLAWQTDTTGREWLAEVAGILTATVTVALWLALRLIEAAVALAGDLMLAFGISMSFALTYAIKETFKARASEIRYRRLFMESRVAMLLIDPADDRIIDANPAAFAFYGYAPAALRAMKITDINTSTVAEIHAELRLARARKKNHFEFRHRLANGEVREVNVSSGPIDIDGRTLLLSIVLDITERKRAETEREQYFKFFNTSSDLMGIADPNGAFKKVNPAFVKTLGYTEAELLAKPFIDFVHPDDRQPTLDEMARQLERGVSLDFENRYVCKDGSLRWLSWRAEVNENEGLTYATARDVTEHHLAEEALHRSEERWKFALEGAGDGVWDWNVQTGEVSFSKRWKEMLGYGEDEIADDFCEWEKRLHPEDKPGALARIQAYFEGLAPDYTLEHRLRCKDGCWKWILARGMIISRTADGKPLRMIGTHSDISEHKRMEADLRETATTDFLTGLYTRRHFMARMEEQLARVQRRVTEVAAVLMLDLDHFKRINDAHGHAAGDALLRHFASVIGEDLRKIDTAGRLGGEEFGIILPGSDAAAAAIFAERLRKRVAEMPLRWGDWALAVTVSIGISEMTAADTSVDASLARADEALYRAKESGRNRVETIAHA